MMFHELLMERVDSPIDTEIRVIVDVGVRVHLWEAVGRAVDYYMHRSLMASINKELW